MSEHLDDLVDRWHRSGSDVPLHQYLNLTWEEYATWVETCRLPKGWRGTMDDGCVLCGAPNDEDGDCTTECDHTAEAQAKQ